MAILNIPKRRRKAPTKPEQAERIPKTGLPVCDLAPGIEPPVPDAPPDAGKDLAGEKHNSSPDIHPHIRKKRKQRKRRKRTAKKQSAKKGNKKKQDQLPPLLQLLLKMTVMAGILTGVLTWIIGLHRMTGNNMFPFIKDGDLCILYKLEEYTTGDVVAYRNEKGVVKMARIVAVAGQDVDFPEEGGYTVDGYQPTEEITYQTFGAEGAKYPVHVGEGQFFVMNDFRSDTDDSRKTGAINAGQICGKLMFLIRRRGF